MHLSQIRSFGSSMCMSLLWTLAFIMIKYFDFLKIALGMHGCMYLFASFSFVGALFVIFVVPETKGKSFEAIMEMLER